jgi:hypothetical protein
MLSLHDFSPTVLGAFSLRPKERNHSHQCSGDPKILELEDFTSVREVVRLKFVCLVFANWGQENKS